MKAVARRVLELADGPLRMVGVLAAAVGVFAVWLIRG
jgi:uncharacterized protein YjeT (DUF2065 family)